MYGQIDRLYGQRVRYRTKRAHHLPDDDDDDDEIMYISLVYHNNVMYKFKIQ